MLGLKAAAFRSGHEFLEAYSPDGPGCLVLDVRLPGMSGLELQKEILARGIHLPTIVVTGFGDVRMAVEAMQAGAMEFLEKPFRTQELCDHIQRAVKLDAANWQERQQRRAVQQQLAVLTRRKRSPRIGRRRKDQPLDRRGAWLERPHRRGPPRRMMRKLKATSRTDLLDQIGVDGQKGLGIRD